LDVVHTLLVYTILIPSSFPSKKIYQLRPTRVPFYAYLRLFVLSYLVLPQTQGAKLLYQTYIHPFLAHHEQDIDKLITSAHKHAKTAGLDLLKRAIEFVKENLFGMPTKPAPSSPGRDRYDGNYAQSLLSRFNLPTARQGLAAPAGDFYSLLSSAMSTINTSAGTSREAQVNDLSRSGTLIPQGITTTSDKLNFLSTQRERLRILLSTLDKQASDLGTEAAIEKDVEKRMTGKTLGEGLVEGLKKSKSEAEFEEIGREEGRSEQGKGGGNWVPWGWGSGKCGEERARATGVDGRT